MKKSKNHNFTNINNKTYKTVNGCVNFIEKRQKNSENKYLNINFQKM